MSDSDEQLDQVASGDTQSDSFVGFEGSTYLRYQVVSDLEGEVELHVEDHLEVSQNLLDRAISESEETYYELEDISDQLRALSPILDINSEIELVQSDRDKSVNSPNRATSSSNSDSCEIYIDKMGVNEAQCQKYCEKLEELVKAAESDIEKARALYDNPSRKQAMLRGMQSRLEFQEGRLIKQEKEVQTYKGKSIDISIYISQSEEARMALIEHRIYMEEAVKEVVAVLETPLVNHGVRIVKTTASHFPEFDGRIDFDIWETNWKDLANNSGLSPAGLLIKLRESLVDRAKEYIGVSGMANLTYDQTWEKLRERYAVSWAKTQQAARKFFNIPPPTNDDQSVISYIDAVRDAVDAVERAGLTPENIFFNIALDIYLKG